MSDGRCACDVEQTLKAMGELEEKIHYLHDSIVGLDELIENKITALLNTPPQSVDTEKDNGVATLSTFEFRVNSSIEDMFKRIETMSNRISCI